VADALVIESPAAFESASELREAHAHLLEALEYQLGQVGPDAGRGAEAAALARLEPEIRKFVERGAATGAYVEEITERIACQSLLDYWVSSLSHAGTHMRGVRLARFDAEQLPDLKDKLCPYVGLEAFRDRTFFFGRETDIDAVVAQLRAAPLVVVAGASGSGKSSLVMGGVLPALKAEGPPHTLSIIPPFVPGNTVIEHLADAILQSEENKSADLAAEAAALRRDPQHLSALLGGDVAPPTLIVIDQFEELFTLAHLIDREALAANFRVLLEAGRGHRVILTVREEFRSRIVELSPLSPYLDKAWYSMRPMGYDALRAAIEKPAERQNLQFQPGIVDDLAKKVLGQPAALPLLQFTLRSLWEARDRNRITWEVYHKIGDPLNALKTSADRFYNNLLDETKLEVKRILLELVRVNDLLEAYRQPVPKSRLLQAGRANTEEVLRLLADNDYVRITPGLDGSDPVVEVKHESLVRNWPLLVGWIDEKRSQVRQRLALGQTAKRWADSGRPTAGLLTGWQLKAVEEQPNLSALEREFLQASAEAIKGEEAAAFRRRTRLIVMAAVLAVIAAICGFGTAAVVLAQKHKIQKLYAQTTEATKQLSEQNQQIREQYTQITEKSNQLMEQDDKLRTQTAEAQKKDREIQRLRQQSGLNVHRDTELLLDIETIRMAQDQPDLHRNLLRSLTTNLEVESTLPGHTGTVLAVKFSPNRQVLASASDDGIILLRDVAYGERLHPPLNGGQGAVRDLAFSRDGKTLASGGDDGVRLWDVATGNQTATLTCGGAVFSLAVRGDSNILAAAGEDGIVRLWNIESRGQIGCGGQIGYLAHSKEQTEGHSLIVQRVAFSPDGTLLASGGEDQRVILWDMRRLRQVGKPLTADSAVFSLAFSHDGKHIAAGSGKGGLEIWNVKTGGNEMRRPDDHLRGVWGVAFTANDQQLVTASRDQTIHIYDLEWGRKSLKAERQEELWAFAELFSLDFSGDRKFVTGTDKGTVIFWDLATEVPIGHLVGTVDGARAIFTGDGRTLVSPSNDKLQFWSADDAASPAVTVRSNIRTDISFVVPAPNGKGLVSVGIGGSIELWDLTTKRPTRTLFPPRRLPKGYYITAAAYSADARTLAVAAIEDKDPTQGEIWLLDTPDGTVRAKAGPWHDRVWALAFSPKGTLLAIADDSSQVSLWDLDNLDDFNQINLPLQYDEPVYDSTTTSGPAYVSSQHHRGLNYGLEIINGIKFSPYGDYLAYGGDDGVVWLWDLKNRTENRLEFHKGPVNSVAFSPDGKQLASGSADKKVIVWDVATGEPLSPSLEGHQAAIKGVDLSADGRWLVSTGNDGSIVVWEMSMPDLLSRACEIAGRNLSEPEWTEFFGDEPYHITCPSAAAVEADALALNGERADAERLFRQATDQVITAYREGANNEVCWLGSLDGFAATVKPACEQAVQLAPNSLKDQYKDSRGLARALTGDRNGAIEDFQATVDWIRGQPKLGGYSEDFLRRRESLIAALRDGRNPFDKQLLDAMRAE